MVLGGCYCAHKLAHILTYFGTSTQNDGNGSTSGHVRVYTNTGSGWVKVGDDIDGEAEFDLSGHSVAMSADGRTVAIGAIGVSLWHHGHSLHLCSNRPFERDVGW